jgi:O-antigen/teichoic acid export membrane protein
MSPLLLGLAALATPIISFLLTDKWLGCVPYLQIACFYYVLQPIQTANLQAIRAVGRSDIILKLDIIKRGFGLLFVLVAMWYGVIWIALAPVAMSLLASIVNIIPNKKLIDYTFKEQMADLLPNLLLSGTMGVGCLLLSNWFSTIGLEDVWIILICVCIGALYYLVGSIISKNKSWIYVLESMKDLFSKKNSQKKEDIESGKQDIK